jgi:hypothetical protein
LLVAFAACLLPVAVASAGQSTLSGKSTDPRGDTLLPADLVKVSAEYRNSGRAEVEVKMVNLDAAAASGVVIGASFSHSKGGKCETQSSSGALLGIATDTGETVSAYVGSDDSVQAGHAKATTSGDTITVSSSDKFLARRGFDCVSVLTFVKVGPSETETLDRAGFRLHAPKHHKR